MRNLKKWALGKLVIICMTSWSCAFEKEEKIEMRWITYDTFYDGLPLYLRIPEILDIEQFKKRYSKLFCITHKFDKVKTNGLPESDYNKSLEDFDGVICDLFHSEKEGLIFLIETFGGKRNYWFYIQSGSDIKNTFERLKNEYPEHELYYTLKNDTDWKFIKDYPINVYDK